MSTTQDGISGARARFCSLFVHDVTEAVFSRGEAADNAAALRFKQDRRIGSRDRRFLNNTLFAYFRWYGWLVKASIERKMDLALAAVTAAEGESSGPAAVWAENAGIPAPVFADALKQKSASERFAAVLNAAGEGMNLSFSLWEVIPEWAKKLLPQELQSDERLPMALQKRSPMWLRAQTARIPELVKKPDFNPVAQRSASVFFDAPLQSPFDGLRKQTGKEAKLLAQLRLGFKNPDKHRPDRQRELPNRQHQLIVSGMTPFDPTRARSLPRVVRHTAPIG